MTSVGYFEPMDEPRGHGTTLVDMLAFPSRDAALVLWEAFRIISNGRRPRPPARPMAPPGRQVTSVYLEPMDYSPMK